MEKIAFSPIKNSIRHKVIESFEDFDDKSKDFLLRLKSEVFENNDIYVHGSRIQGRYLTDEEYDKYSKEYKFVKRSDWDIQSLVKPKNLKEFELNNSVKIDFQLGTFKIKV